MFRVQGFYKARGSAIFSGGFEALFFSTPFVLKASKGCKHPEGVWV